MEFKEDADSIFAASLSSLSLAVPGHEERPEAEEALLRAVPGEIGAKRRELLQRARKREGCARAVAELIAVSAPREGLDDGA